MKTLSLPQSTASTFTSDRNLILDQINAGELKTPQKLGWRFQAFSISDESDIPETSAQKLLKGKESTGCQDQAGHRILFEGEPTSIDSQNLFSDIEADQERAMQRCETHGLRVFPSSTLFTLRPTHFGQLANGFDEAALMYNLDLDTRGVSRYKAWNRENAQPVSIALHGRPSITACSSVLETLFSRFTPYLSVKPDLCIDALNIATRVTPILKAAFVACPRLFGHTGQSQDYSYPVLRGLLPSRACLGPKEVESLQKYLDIIGCFNNWSAVRIGEGKQPHTHGHYPHLRSLSNDIHWGVKLNFHQDALSVSTSLIDSGTPYDNTSFLVAWTGVMRYYLANKPDVWKSNPYDEAVNNLEAVCTYGLDAQVRFCGATKTAKDMILDQLLPNASSGVSDLQDPSSDAYLTRLAHRVEKGQTLSKWIRQKTTDRTSWNHKKTDKLLTDWLYVNRFSSIDKLSWDF